MLQDISTEKYSVIKTLFEVKHVDVCACVPVCLCIFCNDMDEILQETNHGLLNWSTFQH